MNPRVVILCCIPLPCSTCHKKLDMEMKQQPRTADVTVAYVVLETASTWLLQRPVLLAQEPRSPRAGDGALAPYQPCGSPPVAQPQAKADKNCLSACTACTKSSVQDPDLHWNIIQADTIPALSPFKTGQKEPLIAVLAFWHCPGVKPVAVCVGMCSAAGIRTPVTQLRGDTSQHRAGSCCSLCQL